MKTRGNSSGSGEGRGAYATARSASQLEHVRHWVGSLLCNEQVPRSCPS
jgi:hypothetical protein